MKAIAAMDPHRVIGYKGKLPWPIIKGDLQFFKQKTMETKKIVMGRDTFRSVGALKDRFTYVLTTDHKLLELPPFSAYRYVNMEFFNNDSFDDLWVCGGAKIYQLLLPRCDEVFITHIIDDYEGDTYMPTFEDHFTRSEIVREGRNHWIVRYWR